MSALLEYNLKHFQQKGRILIKAQQNSKQQDWELNKERKVIQKYLEFCLLAHPKTDYRKFALVKTNFVFMLKRILGLIFKAGKLVQSRMPP